MPKNVQKKGSLKQAWKARRKQYVTLTLEQYLLFLTVFLN